MAKGPLSAFATLVHRHVNLVYSAGLRQGIASAVENRHELKEAFTVVEVLVCIAGIGILATLLGWESEICG